MEFKITPTLIWYYHICPREVWLMSRNLVPEQHNDNIEIGRFLHEHSYQRNKKEIQIGSAKFDMITKKDGMLVLGEIKKSSKYEEASKMQLAYYLYLLEQRGVLAHGELRIPTEKKIVPVALDDALKQKIRDTEAAIQLIIQKEKPPAVVKIGFCKNCAYKEFCYS